MEQMRLWSNMPRPKPKFWYKENGAYVLKDGKGGINQYWYQDEVLKPYLLPFAKECKEGGSNYWPDIVVMENGALGYKLVYSNKLYISWEVVRMLWLANSLDLNIIEPCQFYMKVEITKKGAIYLDEELRAVWVKCWEELLQWRIQAWIKRIIKYIKQVILLEGGNYYKEGRLKG